MSKQEIRLSRVLFASGYATHDAGLKQHPTSVGQQTSWAGQKDTHANTDDGEGETTLGRDAPSSSSDKTLQTTFFKRYPT
eukprot:4013596-Pyramimonas_sp.AAC.1